MNPVNKPTVLVVSSVFASTAHPLYLCSIKLWLKLCEALKLKCITDAAESMSKSICGEISTLGDINTYSITYMWFYCLCAFSCENGINVRGIFDCKCFENEIILYQNTFHPFFVELYTRPIVLYCFHVHVKKKNPNMKHVTLEKKKMGGKLVDAVFVQLADAVFVQLAIRPEGDTSAGTRRQGDCQCFCDQCGGLLIVGGAELCLGGRCLLKLPRETHLHVPQQFFCFSVRTCQVEPR